MNDCFRFSDWQGRLVNVPPFPGKLRVINGAAALTHWLRGDERAVELWPDAPFYVNLQDRIQRQMWMGCYENHVTRCVAALIGSGDTFLDIGAHIGYHSYFAAGLVGTVGCVFSFEPDPALYVRLARNLSSFSWARTENAAIWSSDSALQFERSYLSSESGWGTLTNVRDLNRGEHIQVRSFALDSWADTVVKLSGLRLVKLDAEGSELAAVAGGASTLNRFRPSILFEINATILKQGGSSAAALLGALADLRYEVYALEFSRVSKLSRLADHEFADCIALPSEQAKDSLNALKACGFDL